MCIYLTYPLMLSHSRDDWLIYNIFTKSVSMLIGLEVFADVHVAENWR